MRGMMRIMFLAALLGLIPALAQAQGKTAVVNLDDALSNSQAGKTGLSQLRTKFEAREKTLTQQGEELKKLQDDLQKQSVALSQEAMRGKAADFEAKAKKYLDERNKLQQEEQQAQQTVLQPLLAKLQKIVGEYAKKHGYSVILEARSVPYFDPSLDITESIRQEFDKSK